MLARAFTDPTLGLGNFEDFVSSPIDSHSLLVTIQTSVIITVICLAIGYPYAYALVHASRRVAATLLTIVLVSLWLNIVARSFAWEVILRDTGVINRLLESLGWINQPLPMMYTATGVIIGMTNILLPWMVLPLYVVMSRIDPELPRASAGLGAGPIRSFATIFFPLSLPGVLAGALLVFVQALGFYITPALLGGGTFLTLSQMIVDQVQHLEWGAASAAGIVLLSFVALSLGLASRFIRVGDFFGASAEN